MKLTHHFTTKDPTDRFNRLATIHRRCLLQLQARGSRAAALSAPVLQKTG